MRFSVRFLVIITTLVAVVVSVAVQVTSRWPQEGWSWSIGVIVWFVTLVVFATCLSGELPRNLSSTLIAILTGVVWMIAFRHSASIVWMFLGFSTAAFGTSAAKQFLPQVLTWCGVEND